MPEIVIAGGGGHATVIISILKKLKVFNIIGYTDVLDKGDVLSVKYLGDDNMLDKIKNEYRDCSAVIGIGMSSLKDIEKRISIKEKLQNIGFDQPAIISPNAVINENVAIGQGTVVFDGVIINSGSIIGEFTSINTNSSVDHDCSIGNHVFISPGVTINGGVHIGNKTFIGSGAVIANNQKICENCVIAAGAVVLNDCLKPGKYLGIPAQCRE